MRHTLAAVLLGAAIASGLPAEEPLLSRTRQLILDGKRSGEGYFSPDGRLMTFQSEREPDNPFYQIYLLDLESGATERISPGHGKTTCSFVNPVDTQVVLFASTHLDPTSQEQQRAELEFRASGQERRYSWDYDPEYDIHAFDRRTKAYTRLTDAKGYDAEGAYSPDGKLVVFASNRGAFEAPLEGADAKRFEVNPAYYSEIYLMNADGTEQRRLTDSPGYDGGPFFSPDGKRILWRRFDAEGLIADIWTMDLEGGDQRRLTDFQAMSWAPYFHPSQQYVFFASNKHGFANFEVFIVDAEGKREPVRVTHKDGFDGLPVPTPDGKRLTWVSNRHGAGAQIWIANWNHEAALAALAASPLRGTEPEDTDASTP
ncbi:MAG: hypothetical protein SF028_05645 [Candidatus Sumerlaeia bacterium]|nr:hypothetical protein [Candidatus Sumerlaeia bacterium]